MPQNADTKNAGLCPKNASELEYYISGCFMTVVLDNTRPNGAKVDATRGGAVLLFARESMVELERCTWNPTAIETVSKPQTILLTVT